MFCDVVDLYRLIGKPELNEANSIEINVPASLELDKLKNRCLDLCSEFGDFNFGNNADGTTKVEATFPSGGNFRFFQSTAEFIKQTPSLTNGEFRDGFYIRALDYADTDEFQPEQITRLRNAVQFINALRQFCEVSANSGDLQNINKLFFFRPSDQNSRQKTTIIPLILGDEFLSFNIPSFKILYQLANAQNDDRLHIEERRLILSISIADIAKDHPVGSLEQLARSWRDVITKYSQDLQAYVSRFAFDTERKKIADSAIEYSTKMSATLNDITGKLLAAPFSVAALAVLNKSFNETEFLLGCLGVFLAFLLYRLHLTNQIRLITQLQSSYMFILSGFFVKQKTFPTVIQSELNKLNSDACKHKKALSLTVKIYLIVAYVPIAAIVGMLYLRFSESVFGFFMNS